VTRIKEGGEDLAAQHSSFSQLDPSVVSLNNGPICILVGGGHVDVGVPWMDAPGGVGLAGIER